MCGLEVGQAVLRASRGYARPQEGGALLWRAALPRTARQRSLHRCFAGPWETVGFGIMGAYGLNKLDEFEARAALCERAALALETVEATKAELATLVEKQDIESRAGRALLKHSKTGSVNKLWMEAAPAEQAESQSGKLVELRSVVTGLRTCGLDDDEEELLQMLSRACNIEDGSSAVDNQVLGAAVQGWMDARAASDLTIKDLRVRLDEELSAAKVRLRAAKVGK